MDWLDEDTQTEYSLEDTDFIEQPQQGKTEHVLDSYSFIDYSGPKESDEEDTAESVIEPF